MTRSAVRTRTKATTGQRLLGGIGEILITLGMLLLLFVAWELWWTNIDAGRTQSQVTSAFAQDLDAGAIGDSTVQSQADESFGPAPVTTVPDGETFGIFYIPRFGKDFAQPVTDGVGMDVLNSVGIGHYPATQEPGEPGNFAVAAHRQTHGQVFWDIDKFQDGDKIHLQTRQGFYTYRWSGTEIVHPTQSEVLLPVPHQPGAEPTASVLTMTSCHPPFTTRMRIIAYAELESWRPGTAGPPQEIAGLVKKTMEN